MDNLGEETPPTRRNPFSERKVLHPALSERPELGPDTWKPLWNGLLESDVFGSWQNPEYQWMLRCVGGPGSGKVSMLGRVLVL